MTGSPQAADSSILAAALRLDAVGADGEGAAYDARTQDCPWPKAYGGDLIAQATAAAMRTVPGERPLHSLHAYFVRPVEIGGSVRYDVELVRDGRSYSTRIVRGTSGGRLAVHASFSFHDGEGGPELARPAREGWSVADVPAPEQVPSTAEHLAAVDPGGDRVPADFTAYWGSGRSFDLRHVPDPVYVAGADPAPVQAIWMRPFGPIEDAPGLTAQATARAALVYACDYTMLEPALRARSLGWTSPGLVTASLDHAMWIHRDVDWGDWLLYTVDLDAMQDGRVLCTGRFHDRDRRLVATVLQEGVIRTPAEA